MSHENDTLKFGGPGDAIVMACPPDVNPDDDSVRYYGGLLVCESASAEWRRRIVACVNACAGIPTDVLEDKSILKADADLRIKRDELERQRDELLAALEKMNRAYVCLMENGRDRIISLGGECDSVDAMERSDQHLRESRAAIASVKGGAA